MTTLLSLPSHLISSFFDFCDHKSLAGLSLVCKSLHELVESPRTWNQLCLNLLGSETTEGKSVFQRKYAFRKWVASSDGDLPGSFFIPTRGLDKIGNPPIRPKWTTPSTFEEMEQVFRFMPLENFVVVVTSDRLVVLSAESGEKVASHNLAESRGHPFQITYAVAASVRHNSLFLALGEEEGSWSVASLDITKLLEKRAYEDMLNWSWEVPSSIHQRIDEPTSMLALDLSPLHSDCILITTFCGNLILLDAKCGQMIRPPIRFLDRFCSSCAVAIDDGVITVVSDQCVHTISLFEWRVLGSFRLPSQFVTFFAAENKVVVSMQPNGLDEVNLANEVRVIDCACLDGEGPAEEETKSESGSEVGSEGVHIESESENGSQQQEQQDGHDGDELWEDVENENENENENDDVSSVEEDLLSEDSVKLEDLLANESDKALVDVLCQGVLQKSLPKVEFKKPVVPKTIWSAQEECVLTLGGAAHKNRVVLILNDAISCRNLSTGAELWRTHIPQISGSAHTWDGLLEDPDVDWKGHIRVCGNFVYALLKISFEIREDDQHKCKYLLTALDVRTGAVQKHLEKEIELGKCVEFCVMDGSLYVKDGSCVQAFCT